MSTLAVNTLQAQTGSTVSVASGQILYAPGHVIQVINSNTNTEFQFSSATLG